MSISLDEARGLILDATRPLGSERVQLLDAAGRALAEDFHAPWDLPRYDNSAMDGFAVRAADAAAQAELLVTGYSPAGGTDLPPVEPGCAVKIMTGAAIPPGCDLVVPFEETEEFDGRVTLADDFAGSRSYPFSRRRHHGRSQGVAGRDSTAAAGNQPVGQFRPGTGAGLYRRPRVAILSTGDELVELGTPLTEGRIINSNALSLAAAVRDAGGEPLLLGIARDTLESHLEKLAEGLTAEVLITSAGVSAGDRDLVRDVLAELGVEQQFWKIDIKPGRPTAFGVKGNTLVFSLPGNPVSTMVTFEMFVRPALRKLQGLTPAIRPYVKALLAEPFRKRPGRTQLLRVQLRSEHGRLLASSAGDQNTGILSTMLRANGIAVLPAERDRFEAGDEVEVLPLD